MHFSRTLLMVGAVCTLVTLTTSQETVPCRRSESVSRCIDPPMPGLNETLCEDRVCAFSYIGAAKCGGDFGTRATHNCLATTATGTSWRCSADGAHKFVLLPVGCEGGACMDEVKTCACETVAVARTRMDPTGVILEECPATEQ